MINSYKALFISWIIFLIGAYLCLGPRYKRQVSWHKRHLNVIEKQLGSIAVHLAEYKEQHGQYPTNEQGLSVLRSIIPDLHYRYLPEVNDADTELDPFERVLRLRRREQNLIISEAGIYSRWHVPFVYENRTELQAEAFVDSPVNDDNSDLYSVNVNGEVAVYSVGSISIAHAYVALQWEIWIVRVATIASFICFLKALLGTLESVARAKNHRLKRKLSFLFIPLLVIVGAPRVSCYMMSFFSKWRRPEILEKQKELLDNQVEKGIISQETAEKIRTTIEEDYKLLEKIQ